MPEKENDSGENAAPTESRVYWFFRNSARDLVAFVRRHYLAASAGLVVALLALFGMCAYLQPLVLGLRKHTFVVLLLAPLIVLLVVLLRRWSWKVQLAALLLLGTMVLLARDWELRAYRYVRLYYRYQTLPLVQLDELPLTDHERIQPLNSIYSLAHEVMTETESPQSPDFVRIGNGYRWSIAIEPAYPIGRMLGYVEEVLSVPGTTASPSFGRENRVSVRFDVGEKLKFSRNSHIATIRRFGIGRFLGYQPADVVYLTDDRGDWVQVVSLIRWTGLLFPRPEFGGVQLIRQARPGLMSSLRRVLFGAGQWIPPDQIPRHEFLVGQNVLAYEVSRFMANSFRFQNGFWAPFPGYHRGDIRIPDLATDVNDQPFTGFFELSAAGGADKLYHYFALEPYDPDKQGLNTSLFVPADGRGQVYVFRHHQISGSLTGVSAISAKVMESKKNYDWTRNRPVEHRPFIRRVGGRTRFFWLTTVVTFKEQDGDRFIAGSVPDVVLTDAAHNTSVWVDPLRPQGWGDQLEERLGSVWARN